MQQIKFNQTDLLNYNENDLLIRSNFPNERAIIITNKLKNYISLLIIKIQINCNVPYVKK